MEGRGGEGREWREGEEIEGGREGGAKKCDEGDGERRERDGWGGVSKHTIGSVIDKVRERRGGREEGWRQGGSEKWKGKKEREEGEGGREREIEREGDRERERERERERQRERESGIVR